MLDVGIYVCSPEGPKTATHVAEEFEGQVNITVLLFYLESTNTSVSFLKKSRYNEIFVV